MEDCTRLARVIMESKNIVFFGGAGVSTESGLKDFRSVDGLYHEQYAYPPEEILSASFFKRNPTEFYRFYRDKLLVSAKPNAAHLFLAKLEQMGKLSAVITQNIDGLHSDAGSKTVFELHGTIRRNYCTRCKKEYSVEKMHEEPYPICSCGGMIRPDVVLYEEMLDDAVVSGAVRAIEEADLLIIGGTSLVVYPAAGLIHYFRGKTIALMNKTATSQDREADIVIRTNIGEAFSMIEQKLQEMEYGKEI
ncbi:MAG: NAD-dependent protein deacylase [Clostridiales bacterium]|nr:NAD-dependent protein deacylase [Clostridiales bacterium]